MIESEESRLARLERNAQLYRFDRHLEHVADLMDAGDTAAWTKLPAVVVDAGSLYADARRQYRAAVRAGAIPDDRNTEKETTTW